VSGAGISSLRVSCFVEAAIGVCDIIRGLDISHIISNITVCVIITFVGLRCSPSQNVEIWWAGGAVCFKFVKQVFGGSTAFLDALFERAWGHTVFCPHVLRGGVATSLFDCTF
jgi:hypothetical protein